MASVTPMQRGEIGTPEGGDRLRGELLNAHTVRCGDDWFASATTYSDGAAEIEVSAAYDQASSAWGQHEYYYSFDKTIRALVVYEATGQLPNEDAL